jgi:hypothetical protein
VPIATEFRYAGCRIQTASNGRQAPEILGADVLADVSMPAMGPSSLRIDEAAVYRCSKRT